MVDWNRWCEYAASLVIAATACSVKRDGSDKIAQSPLDRAGPGPAMHQDPEFVAIAISGTFPDLIFEFTECVSGKPTAWIRNVNIARNNHLVCALERVAVCEVSHLCRSPSSPGLWHVEREL